jgi:uncharacterized membrane protein YeaQ/YmgE (transglycosylase-associated protein family)
LVDLSAGIIGVVFAGWVFEMVGIPRGTGIIELIIEAITGAMNLVWIA